jgi:hypothetical protein
MVGNLNDQTKQQIINFLNDAIKYSDSFMADKNKLNSFNLNDFFAKNYLAKMNNVNAEVTKLEGIKPELLLSKPSNINNLLRHINNFTSIARYLNESKPLQMLDEEGRKKFAHFILIPIQNANMYYKKLKQVLQS